MSRTSPQNQKNVDKFFKQIANTDIKVFKFTMKPNDLRALFDFDPTDYQNTCTISSLSEKIDQFIAIPESKKQEFVCSDNYDWYDWIDPDLYVCYQMYKVLWLCENIRLNGQQAPVQFIKTCEAYHCHPGSDKKYAITLLEPIPEIKCFYIYYPNIDYVFDIPADLEPVNTPEEFINMFPMAHHNTFEFEIGDVAMNQDEYKCSGHFEPFAREAQQTVKSENKGEWSIQVPHISYRDSIHRENMLNFLENFSSITLDKQGIFNLGPYKFHNIKDVWTPEIVLNLPTSLVDRSYVHDQNTAVRMKK